MIIMTMIVMTVMMVDGDCYDNVYYNVYDFDCYHNEMVMTIIDVIVRMCIMIAMMIVVNNDYSE